MIANNFISFRPKKQFIYFCIKLGEDEEITKQLEDKGFVARQVDENNRRQNKVSLTEKGKETLEKAKEIVDAWENEIIKPKGYIEKELLQQILKEIAINTIELNHKGE